MSDTEYSDEYEIILSEDSDTSLIFNPLDKDLEEYCGIFAWKEEFINNETHIYLRISLENTISEITGSAWGIEVSVPIIVKLVMNSYEYRQHFKPPPIEVYGNDENNLYQLKTILQRFFNCLWSLGKNDEWEQIYMENYEDEINAYLEFIDDPYDAVILHKLYKNDVNAGIDFYNRKDNNLFNLAREYLLYRLPTICRYCLHCDQIPIFMRNRDMELLKPFVCGNPLCHFQLSHLEMGADIASGITGSANLVHLLAMMTVLSAKSKKWREKILNPFPALVSHDDPTQMYLNPEEPDYDQLAQVVEAIPLERVAYFHTDYRLFKENIEAIHPYGYDLLQWIISSNRAHITDIPETIIIPDTGTTEQYLMLLDSPVKEAEFQRLKAEHGTVYAFHGSPFMNFHSILRNGLYNASGTELQRHGKVHGDGIYLSPSLTFSKTYCKDQGYSCLAFCEVINDGIMKKTKDIWTISDSAKVCTRFLFVYNKNDKETQKTSNNFLSTSEETLDAIQAVYSYFGMT